MSKNSNYDAGFRWGKKTIKESYLEEGHRGLGKCDKAAQTCYKYATDKKLTKTKKGKPLTSAAREYYKGISDGMSEGYNDLF